MVDENVAFVARTLRAAGVPRSDIDDEMQRTFIAAAHRIDDVRPGAERSFLFQVALNMAAHARRALARRREIPSAHLPEMYDPSASPDQVIVRKQTRKLIGDVVDGMDASLRSVFTLFELEEMRAADVAEVLGVARGTVASRVRRARVQFRDHAEAIALASHRSVLERALLNAGACVPACSGARGRTLAALGLAQRASRRNG
jgi:RNA polymerase sigma-70 factor (ECF subfamily)